MRRTKLPLALAITLTAALMVSSTHEVKHQPSGTVGGGLRPPPSVVVDTKARMFLAPTTTTARATITTIPSTTTTATPTKTATPTGFNWNAIFTRFSRQLPGIWIVQQNEDNTWGQTRLSTGEVYIDPDTPVSKLRDVMYHEAGHVYQGRVYGGIEAAQVALMPYGGLEAVADCIAKILGAQWTYYVQNCTSGMNYAARQMLQGEPA